MIKIEAREKYLSYSGDADYALRLVDSLHDAYHGTDMPKMLNDFVFNIEVALQNAGVLDENFTQKENWRHNAPYNSEFLGAQPPKINQDY